MKKYKTTLFALLLCFFVWTPIACEQSPGQSAPHPETSENVWLTNTLLTNTLIGVVTGVLSSLIASGLFWVYLYKQKPNIEISSNIATWEDPEHGVVYAIKIINRTPKAVINIKFQLHSARVIGYNNSQPNIKLHKLQIGSQESVEELMVINPFNPKDSEATYAHQLVIVKNKADIESECVDNNSFLLFRVIATHSSSGFSDVFEQRYSCPLALRLKPGKFTSGAEMKIE